MAVLMAMNLEVNSYPPGDRVPLVELIDTELNLEILPGQLATQLRLNLPMSWEAVTRYMDELYMKAQTCLSVTNGLVDLKLRCRDRGCRSSC